MSSASTVCVATRRVVALCSVRSAQPSLDLITEIASTRRTARRSSSGHQAALGAVTTLVASYFADHFPAGAQLHSLEETHAEVRFGLLWRLPDGDLLADDLQTGRMHANTFASRAEAHAAAGRLAFGDRFAGVRVVGLRTATTFSIDGRDGSAS